MPVGWLRPGRNEFILTERSPRGSWDHNNLRIGIVDSAKAGDDWWCETDRLCCSGSAEGIRARRSDGDLLMFLELNDGLTPGSAARELRVARTQRDLANLLVIVGDAMLERGHPVPAARCFAFTRELFSELGGRPGDVAIADLGLGRCAMELGELGRAERRLLNAYAVFRSASNLSFQHRTLEALARLNELQGRHGEAGRYRLLLRALPLPIHMQPDSPAGEAPES